MAEQCPTHNFYLGVSSLIWRRKNQIWSSQNEDDLKNKDYLKIDENLKNEDNLENEDNLKNEDDLKNQDKKMIMTLDERWPWTKDYIWWKMTFDGRHY